MFSKHKKKITITLLVVMVLSVLIGAFAPLIAFASSETKIDIIHVNDVHGRINEDEREGALGFAKFQTKLKEMREETDNLLLLNAGDTLHGTTEVNLSEGENILELMGDLGFDAMVPGNHDFNYGYDRLVELKGMASFPIITSNVTKGGKSDFDSYIIKEIDGIKIGIFGLTTEETMFKTHPDNVKGVEFENPVESAKKAVKALEKEGVDFVISLVHLGIEGTTLTTAEDVLNEVDGIDLMIDGHSHEEMSREINGTKLVQAGQYTQNLGLVELTFKDKELEEFKATLLPYEELKDLEADEEIVAKLEKIEEENKKVLGIELGETKVRLDGEREDVRTKETNLGNLITDAMLESTGADIAFTNGGGIRASIEPGVVTLGDVVTSFPFTNTVAVIEATGEEVLAALERGVDSFPEQAGHFPQVAGMTYSFNPEAPVGERIVEVKVAGKAIDPKATYKVVTNDFLAAGGDGYTMFEGKPFVAEGGLLSDVLRDYFEKHKVVDPKVEGRITIAEGPAVETPEKPVDKGDVKIQIDGRLLPIAEELGKPFIKNDRVLVPLRAVSEGLGHQIKWDGKARKVSIDDRVVLTIDSKKAVVDGKELELEIAPFISGDRTYVTIRAISEALGHKVDWDETTNTVIIETLAEVKPAA